MTSCTESIHVDDSPERVGSFVGDVHNLPRWTGFFRAVGPPDGDRWEVRTAMGTTIRTRVDRRAGGYTISSLVGDREERAELAVAAAGGGGTDVRFTVRLLPALAARHAHEGDAVAVQRERMRGELQRLRDAVISNGADA
jgi:hypothetical protein